MGFQSEGFGKRFTNQLSWVLFTPIDIFVGPILPSPCPSPFPCPTRSGCVQGRPQGHSTERFNYPPHMSGFWINQVGIQPRSGDILLAWGASPRTSAKKTPSPVGATDDEIEPHLSPLRGFSLLAFFPWGLHPRLIKCRPYGASQRLIRCSRRWDPSAYPGLGA